MTTGWRWGGLAAGLMAAMGGGWAQGQSIYTCVDKVGRKFTADRPIPECMDREQKILNPSGTLKSVLTPHKSEKELADLSEQKKKDAEIQTRLEDEKRRDRALIGRYPNKTVHDKSRAEILKGINSIRETAVAQVKELTAERDKIAAELEFYKKNPETAPVSLRRRAEDNTRSISEQRQLMAQQDREVARTNARYDEELTRLKPQWAMRESPAR